MESGQPAARRTTPTPQLGNDRPEPSEIAKIFLAISSVMGIGLLIISRWVAETRDASIILGGVWIALAGVVTWAYFSRKPELRRTALVSFAVTAIGIGAVGWYTGFRDKTVDEDLVVATQSATGAEREAALAGAGSGGSGAGATDETAPPAAGGAPVAGGSGEDEGEKAEKKKKPKPKPAGPVSLAKGDFIGVDGHSGNGVAEVIKDGNKRTLTFSNFSTDPGPQVVVWLTRGPDQTDDRIELGGLKGNVGDQQYEIPNDADLNEYDTVVVYCVPFTTRMTVAELK